MPAAARVTDNLAHPAPPVLTGGPGSPNVTIGDLPAWRGVPADAAAKLQAAKTASDAAIQTADDATKASAAAAMSSAITAGAAGADIHTCATPLPTPPHGPGVVIDGSKTVLINDLPACRMGDTVLEAVGPPNKITKGEFTVDIGG